jgi:acetyl/propionyl-CoA carboxylase alpha subunit
VQKVLVANRGEIALRVFRAARELGLGTVAVVAPDDAGSLHARSADETVAIASYLSSEEHIRAAKEAGADAIHPGYGFLAENGDFAEAVQTAGLTWIGPPPDALRAGGDKLAAKRIAEQAGVPTIPETDEPPLIVKAAAGGGGRGMRVVRARDALDEAVQAARREAKAAFGDDTVYLERYVERPRHVEIQLLADEHGTVLSLGERDCSVQRRHQKVLEESPSPALDPDLRARMSDAAVRFARAIGYVGAGTAEFMLEGRDFYFLELNGRIQVEHPVTEAVTGIDLVQWQLRIARGEALDPLTELQGTALQGIALRGAAVEVRLYAEDPRTFLPQAGRIEKLRLPTSVRVDAGVAEGDEVGTSYDPMIAKLIASGATRDEALDRLAQALAETEVVGVTTNLPFLRWLVAHPALRAGETTTAFLVDHPPLSTPPAALPDEVWRGPFRLNLPSPAPQPPPDIDAATHAHGAGTGSATVTAPMPGTVIKVNVHEGETVDAGDPLVVLEAMKMETPLLAPFGATVKAVHVGEGDRVAGGAVLVELDDDDRPVAP